jgi:hypothetical protein|tara:strand:+ start:1266 stop:1628 length:363 start_codon:yes stop_codon:yes gene_type:complete
MDDIYKAIDTMIDQAKADYRKWNTKANGDIPEVNENMIKEFDDGWEVKDSSRQKFIKIIRHDRGGSRSVWGFVNKHDFKHFKRGDILKAAGWNAPALNQPRGNVFVPGYIVKWTGPLYLN